jgi:hypothetical protein
MMWIVFVWFKIGSRVYILRFDKKGENLLITWATNSFSRRRIRQGSLCKYVKVKLSRYAMQAPKQKRKFISYLFLTSALDGSEWSASRPGRVLPPRKGTPVTTGHEAGWASELVRRLEEKILFLCRGSNPGRPVCRPTELPQRVLQICYSTNLYA